MVGLSYTMSYGYKKKHFVESTGHNKYLEAANLIRQAADYMDIRDKNVLVIGTEVPWVETLLLERRPR